MNVTKTLNVELDAETYDALTNGEAIQFPIDDAIVVVRPPQEVPEVPGDA